MLSDNIATYTISAMVSLRVCMYLYIISNISCWFYIPLYKKLFRIQNLALPSSIIRSCNHIYKQMKTQDPSLYSEPTSGGVSNENLSGSGLNEPISILSRLWKYIVSLSLSPISFNTHRNYNTIYSLCHSIHNSRKYLVINSAVYCVSSYISFTNISLIIAKYIRLC